MLIRTRRIAIGLRNFATVSAQKCACRALLCFDAACHVTNALGEHVMSLHSRECNIARPLEPTHDVIGQVTHGGKVGTSGRNTGTVAQNQSLSSILAAK